MIDHVDEYEPDPPPQEWHKRTITTPPHRVVELDQATAILQRWAAEYCECATPESECRFCAIARLAHDDMTIDSLRPEELEDE